MRIRYGFGLGIVFGCSTARRAGKLCRVGNSSESVFDIFWVGRITVCR